MSKLRVNCYAMSVDGFAAGPDQSQEHPLGVGGQGLHTWHFKTRTFNAMHGGEGGETGIDDDFVVRGIENIGAWILGRSMFGPVRGAWPDESWKGWWGDNPPYHCDVFVLTHHPRAPFAMEGGTTFHFVTGGIKEALERAQAASAGKDVRLGGGAATIRQYLQARLIDEMHVAISPVILGRGEQPFAGLDLKSLGYSVTQHVASPRATHIVLSHA